MNVLLVNGNIITGDRARPRAKALAVRGDAIVLVGDNQSILALQRRQTDVIDLQGKTVVPGFNDSHMHLINYGLSLDTVDLRDCRSLSEVRQRISEYIRAHNLSNSWVYGWGWNQQSLREKRMPESRDIDTAGGDNYVFLMRTCNHACTVNSKALERAGIKESPIPVAGGEVQVDERGRPTGILKENAMKLVLNMMPPRDKDHLKSVILRALQNCLKLGLTSLQTDDFGVVKENFRDVLAAYMELDREGQLPIRVNKQLLLPDRQKLASFLELGLQTGDGSPFFKIGPLKLLLDGSLGARTAALHWAYADDPFNTGMTLLSGAELEDLVMTADRHGLQVAIHAIGDKTMDMILDVYKKVNEENPRKDRRSRIIHCSIANSQIMERFKEYQVVADVQPSFVASDFAFVEDRLGEARARWVYSFKSFLERGIPLAGGSDCPIESCNPLLGIHAAVTRTNPAGLPKGGWLPREKLSVQEALHMFTAGSAYCTYEENSKGILREGKLADLVVLSQDIFCINPSDIKDVVVEMTMVGGKVLHSTLE